MDGSKFGSFGKHSARILRRQLVMKLVEEYLNSRPIPEADIPSFQRFHGALLFIDISGFTALSTKLNVEELKNHINGYFTKMLSIVDKYEGDVVKFAGDALFIIWQTSRASSHANPDEESNKPKDANYEQEFARLCQISVTKAVNCGMEINQACCDHEVKISGQPPSPSADSATPAGRNFLPSLGLNLFGGSNSPAKPKEEIVFLNVHSG